MLYCKYIIYYKYIHNKLPVCKYNTLGYHIIDFIYTGLVYNENPLRYFMFKCNYS